MADSQLTIIDTGQEAEDAAVGVLLSPVDDEKSSARPLSIGAQCHVIACIEPSAHSGRTEAGGVRPFVTLESGSCMLDLAQVVEPVRCVP